jgi:multicomponent Na+:H+ antiporter subunit B
VIGTGLVIALLTALAPVAWGAPVLSTTKLAVALPLLGRAELQTSVFLDVGVYVLIIGVVLDLLRALGTGIERDMRDAGEDA